MHLFDFPRIASDILRAPRFVKVAGESGPRVLVAPSVANPIRIVDDDSECITRFNHNLALPFKLQTIVFRDETFLVEPGSFIRASNKPYGVNPSFRYEFTAPILREEIGETQNQNALTSQVTLAAFPTISANFNKETPDYSSASLRIVRGGETIDVNNEASKLVGTNLLVLSDVTICKNPNVMRFELTSSGNTSGEQNVYAKAGKSTRRGEYVRETVVESKLQQPVVANNSTIEHGPGQPGGYSENRPAPQPTAPSDLMDFEVDEAATPSTSTSTAARFFNTFTGSGESDDNFVV